MNTLPINSLIQYDESNGEIKIFRLIYSDIVNDIGFIIKINNKKGLPIFCRPSLLIEDINLQISKLITDDPWAKSVNENELSEKEKEIRNNAWKIIEKLISPKNEPSIYNKNNLGKAVQQIVKDHNTTSATVYKYFRKYLQRGKIKNALLPDYQNSGSCKARNVTKKLGRKRKFNHITEIGDGINIDENIKKIFRVAISQFYYNPQEMHLQTAYNLMLKEYFSEDRFDSDGLNKPLLLSQENKPTYTQFYYFYQKEKDVKKQIISRKGKGAYELTHRAILGNSTKEVFGPGLRYEIDSTVADVYLVSRFNRNWIIGRPIVYIAIDVFSRMIAGIYVGLEGPSWLGATMALANTITNKVNFCKEYDISIEKEDWACEYLPDILLADGGELAGKAIETLATNLNVRIETTPPYRGDLKGIVERYFRTIHEKVKPFAPGYVIKDKTKRRGYDYRLDAKLDIYQFTKLIITGIIQHNRSYLNYYIRDEEMIANDVSPIPKDLWQWGIENRSGIPRHFSEDIVKLNLLPSDYGRITRRGIQFMKMSYSCEKAIKEGWFDKDNSWNGKKVQIVYDFRNLNQIYLREKNGRGFEICYLLETEKKYVNRDYYEITHYHNQEQLNSRLNQPTSEQEFSDIAAISEQVIKEADELFAKNHNKNVSKASRVKNITDNRRFERDKIREKEAFELGKKEVKETATIIPITSKNIEEIEIKSPNDEFNQPNKLELLMKIRKQKQGIKSND